MLIVVGAVGITTSDGFRLLHSRHPGFSFALLRRMHEIAAVHYCTGLGDSPLQHFRREIVTVTEVRETDYVVLGFAVRN